MYGVALQFGLRVKPRLSILCGVLSLAACAHGDDLGRRARRAADRGQLSAFDSLMSEARQRSTRSTLAAPERTVFTHFLALAGHPGFPSALERFRERGWIPVDQECSIARARHRALHPSDPAGAEEAARSAVELARASAPHPSHAWVLKACLQDALFLTETSTTALEPWLMVVADPAEPAPLRQALLQGMTVRWLLDPARQRQLRLGLSPKEAEEMARAEFERERARFIAVLEAGALAADPPTLASGTAVGALELERLAGTVGRGFLDEFAGPSAPQHRIDLAEAWLLGLSSGPRHPRLDVLGLWRSDYRPRVRWFACLDQPTKGRARAIASVSGSAPNRAACPPASLKGPFWLLHTMAQTVGGRTVSGL